MLVLPPAAEPLIARFSVAFYHPTFQRFILLTVGAILARGQSLMTIYRTLAIARRGHLG